MEVVLIIKGKKATEEERKKFARRGGGIQGIIDARQAPGGHAPYNATGHTSLSAAVHPSQAKAHAAWIKEQGLVGVEVEPDGSIKTFSAANKEQYLKARGLADMSNAGAGEFKGQTQASAARGKKKRTLDRAGIKAQAKKIRQDPKVKAILNSTG